MNKSQGQDMERGGGIETPRGIVPRRVGGARGERVRGPTGSGCGAGSACLAWGLRDRVRLTPRSPPAPRRPAGGLDWRSRATALASSRRGSVKGCSLRTPGRSGPRPRRACGARTLLCAAPLAAGERVTLQPGRYTTGRPGPAREWGPPGGCGHRAESGHGAPALREPERRVNPFVVLVPHGWYTEDALAAVRVLRQIIVAIREVHGERMAEDVGAAPDGWPLDEIRDVAEFKTTTSRSHRLRPRGAEAGPAGGTQQAVPSQRGHRWRLARCHRARWLGPYSATRDVVRPNNKGRTRSHGHMAGRSSYADHSLDRRRT